MLKICSFVYHQVVSSHSQCLTVFTFSFSVTIIKKEVPNAQLLKADRSGSQGVSEGWCFPSEIVQGGSPKNNNNNKTKSICLSKCTTINGKFISYIPHIAIVPVFQCAAFVQKCFCILLNLKIHQQRCWLTGVFCWTFTGK